MNELGHSETSPAQIFETIWAESIHALQTDPSRIPDASRCARRAVLHLVADDARSGKTILEVGSGTGIITLELSRLGGQCTLLDLSPSALSLSRSLFQRAAADGEFVRGTMFSLPFSTGYYDVIWSSGVLEHSEPSKTYAALCEMGRVTKRGGKIISLVPSSRAVFYRLGKFWKERTGTWNFGYERPVRTLRKSCPPGFEVETETQVGVYEQTKFLPRPFRRLVGALVYRLTDRNDANPLLARLIGGYLLVSVFRKSR
jgi:SAM-dependent methyltransferase